ncbi:MAG: hypothetical protein R2862_00675 [Thermoanaerobaculia bacterium]
MSLLLASLLRTAALTAIEPPAIPTSACLTDGQVEDLLLHDGVLYLAGRFLKVRPPGTDPGDPGEVDRRWFAACDAASGAVLAHWDPQIDCLAAAAAAPAPAARAWCRRRAEPTSSSRESSTPSARRRGRTRPASRSPRPPSIPRSRPNRTTVSSGSSSLRTSRVYLGRQLHPCRRLHTGALSCLSRRGRPGNRSRRRRIRSGDHHRRCELPYRLQHRLLGRRRRPLLRRPVRHRQRGAAFEHRRRRSGHRHHDLLFAPRLSDSNPSDPYVQVHDIRVDHDWVYACSDWWETSDWGGMQDQRNVNRFHPLTGIVDESFWIATDGGVQACDLDPGLGVLFVGGHFDCVRAYLGRDNPVDHDPAQCGTDPLFLGTLQRDMFAPPADGGLVDWNPDTSGIGGTWAMSTSLGRLDLGGELGWPRTGTATHANLLTFALPLFADDFESGDRSRWSTTVP